MITAVAALAHSGVSALAQGTPPSSLPGSDQRRAAPGNLIGHGGPVKVVRVDATGARALTGSFDYAMALWDLSGAAPRLVRRFDDHGGPVNAVAFHPDGERALSAGDDGTLTVWRLADGARLARFNGHQSKIVALAVSKDGRYAATASWDRTARLWDLAATDGAPRALAGHTAPVNAVLFSDDGEAVFTAGGDGQILRFDRATGELVRPVHRHGWGINVMERLPGSDRLLFGALNGTVALVDAESGELVSEFKGHQRPVLALAVLAEPPLIATGGGDGVLRVSSVTDGLQIEEHKNPFGPIWALAILPGGRSMYYGGLDDFATRWQIAPRVPFETVDSSYPRRFQVSGRPDDPLALGELQFARKCSVCHTLTPDGANRAGPTLYGVFGRRIATLPGYAFSEKLRTLDIVWTPTTLSRLFELGPDVYTPGSKMPLQVMSDPRERAALIAFLEAATVAGPPPASAGPAGGATGETKH